MIAVLLWILGALAWILLYLILLPIAVLILLAVLLCILPIRYSVNSQIGENNSTSVKVSYLFGLVGFVYEFEDGKSVSVFRLLWFRWVLGEDPTENIKKSKSAVKASKAKQSVKKEGNTQEEPENDKQNIVDKLKAILTYPELKTIIKLIFNALRKTCRVILPRRLRISGEVGFEDPSTTGFLMGAYEAGVGMLRLRDKINIIGNFTADSTIIRLNIFARGSVSVARLSIPFIMLVIKKPIRTLIKDILWRKEVSDE